MHGETKIAIFLDNGQWWRITFEKLCHICQKRCVVYVVLKVILSYFFNVILFSYYIIGFSEALHFQTSIFFEQVFSTNFPTVPTKLSCYYDLKILKIKITTETTFCPMGSKNFQLPQKLVIVDWYCLFVNYKHCSRSQMFKSRREPLVNCVGCVARDRDKYRSINGALIGRESVPESFWACSSYSTMGTLSAIQRHMKHDWRLYVFTFYFFLILFIFCPDMNNSLCWMI